jgi:hypothetical protein
MASTRADLIAFLDPIAFYFFCLGTQLLSPFLSKDLCVKVSILNSPKQPNNIPTQLASTNPGYQTYEKSEYNLARDNMYEGRNGFSDEPAYQTHPKYRLLACICG